MAEAPQGSTTGNRGNLRILVMCLTMVASMGALAYASVPLYRLFCQVTGYGGTTRVAAAPAGEISDREITVRFDANIRGLGWTFKPEQRSVTVRLGETVMINYVAVNEGDTATTGSATFNVTPQATGSFFNKVQCFCFTETTLQPGEKLQMPVVFFVDPDILNYTETKDVHTITLSYTFFPVEAKPVAARRDETGSGAAGG